jgi:uncharacterized membrane protein
MSSHGQQRKLGRDSATEKTEWRREILVTVAVLASVSFVHLNLNALSTVKICDIHVGYVVNKFCNSSS